MNPFDFHIPTKIVFGRGRAAELGTRMRTRARRFFVVTDRTVAEMTPALETVVRGLHGREVRVFDEVEENPSIETVEAAAQDARDFEADMIVGVGGGSPMDAAKGVALLAANPGDLRTYLAGAPLLRPPLPTTAVPTTSGTGSEATPYAVFTDPAAGDKVGYGDPGLFPVLALIDPELTYSMPEAVVVNTGLDVLAHAVEAFLSTLAFPLNDALALHAADTVLAHLGRAARKDFEAMDRMAAAAAVAGAAIAHSSTILPHIMGYPLTVYHGVPHGRASALLLVHVLAHLKAAGAVPDKVEALEARLSPRGGLEGFLRDLGVETRLSAYGLREKDLPLYARKTMVKSDIGITPVGLTAATLEAIYRKGL